MLFGARKSAQGKNEWQLPGGWIESGESPLQAAHREVLEETGLLLQEPRFVGLSNNVFSPQSHSLSLYFEAECADVESLAMAEPGNCAVWEWKNWTELSENLFLPLRLFRQTGYKPFLQHKYRTYVAI